MKKSNLIMLAAILVLSVIFVKSEAQVAMNSSRTKLDDASALPFKVHTGGSVVDKSESRKEFQKRLPVGQRSRMVSSW